MSNRPAPIALFVYNRPSHTRDTLAALRANPLADRSDLHIFSDAPKNDGSASAVAEVRAIVKEVSGFRSVRVVEREENFGLARSITEGVTQICRAEGRVIVLEDDLVVAPGFLEYMNGALDFYADDPNVMHVSGYMFPVRRREQLPKLFFLRVSSCWGWATWDRAWSAFEADTKTLLSHIDAIDGARAFDLDGTYPYYEMLKRNLEGKIDSWAVRWYASVFLRKGFALHPAYSLVDNRGHDGSGQHCDPSSTFDVEPGTFEAGAFPADVRESAAAFRALREFNREVGTIPVARRIWNGLRSRLSRKNAG